MALTQGASFDADEHLATLDLRRVGKARDRLALECVSRVWRAAGQIPGVWQSQDLILNGDLAARLTDARLGRLLRRAGPNLRSLFVNDAPAAVTGAWLRAYAALVDEARGRAGVAGLGASLPTPDPSLRAAPNPGPPSLPRREGERGRRSSARLPRPRGA